MKGDLGARARGGGGAGGAGWVAICGWGYRQGAALTGSQVFAKDKLGEFARVRWVSEDASTLYQKCAAVGVTKSVFRDSRIDLGTSWGQPVDSDVVTVIGLRDRLTL